MTSNPGLQALNSEGAGSTQGRINMRPRIARSCWAWHLPRASQTSASNPNSPQPPIASSPKPDLWQSPNTWSPNSRAEERRPNPESRNLRLSTEPCRLRASLTSLSQVALPGSEAERPKERRAAGGLGGFGGLLSGL